MRSRAIVSGLVLGTTLATGGWLVERGVHGGSVSTAQSARLLDDVLRHVARFYIDSVPVDDLYRKAAEGTLLELNDPHSVLLSPERLGRLTEATTGRYGGIGVQIDVRDGWITIVAPLPATPASEQGMQTGDRIVQIDGNPTHGWTPDEAQKALRGPPGSTVRLQVERPGVDAKIPFSITRREIQTHVVRHALMLRQGVGYLDLTTFSEEAAADVEHAIDSLEAAGMRTLVFDLRGDPGGLLDQGVGVADLFLNPGQKIVSMRGRTPDANHEFADHAPQRWPDLRLIVLVDSGSASASEITAGALQDHDRALILGTTTYGKGSAQSLFPVLSGGALKLTTALWFTPVGRSINRPHPSSDDEESDADASPDSTPRPKYRTDAGREVLGGGGITPDVIVADAQLDSTSRAFEAALGKQIPAFRDALTAYALSLKARGAVTSPEFVVTPAMRAELYQRLVDRGIHVAPQVWSSAGPLVDRLAGYAIARYTFGEQAEFARTLRDDAVIRRALGIAVRPGDQKALLSAR